jgi:hypothetical protein
LEECASSQTKKAATNDSVAALKCLKAELRLLTLIFVADAKLQLKNCN